MFKIRQVMLCLLLAVVSVASAQSKQVSGLVTSESDGAPIPGATIQVKGQDGGTISDIDGEFTIKVSNNSDILVISFIGMESKEVTIGEQKRINVALGSSAQNMEEVLVIAYGTSTKGTFTGSATVVDAETIEKRQVSNITEALAGTSSGVQVLNSNGQPGTASSVRIRGVGSINAGSEPLYVVDGVPFDGDMSSISPSDIEAVTVLKDAASTSLYGARGANGIIMITTKKGKSGKAKVNINARAGINSRGVDNYDVLTSAQNYTETSYQAIYNAGLYNLGYSAADAHTYANNNLFAETNGGSGYQVYTIPDGENLIGTNGSLNPNATLGYSDGEYYYTPDNWADETFQNNMRQEYNISISGGDNKNNYYISMNYLDDEGIVSGSGYERYSARFKGDHKVKDWLKVGVNANYNKITSSYPDEQTSTSSSGNAFFIANFMAPIYPLYVRDGSTQEIISNQGRLTYDYGDGVSTNNSRSFMSIANPLGDLTYNNEEYLMDIINSNLFAEITPIEGLKLRAQYGINVDNTAYGSLGNVYMGQSAAYGGTAYQSSSRTVGFNQQYIADYTFDINSIHNFNITAGYDGYSYTSQNVYASGQNLYNPESYYVNNAIDNIQGGGSKSAYATKGAFIRANYSLKETYFFNLAYRRDASSRFSPENRWGDFWSTSAAWKISDESFFNVDGVDMLKLKGSIGEQGNDQIGNYYAYLDQYSTSGADGVFSSTLSYVGNPDLTWETSLSYNLGLDFALFGSNLNGSVEYFGRKSSDMLYYKPVAGSNGYTQLPMNVGSMTNSGIEIELGYTILKTQNITWDINANATFINNEINELHPDLDGQLIDGSRIWEEGESAYRFNLVEYAGVDEETGKALYWAADEDTGEEYKTDDYTIAQENKKATENILAKVYGGFGTGIDAYGFDASIQCSYQLGGQIYDSGYARLMHGGTSSYAGQNWHKDIYNAWTPTNTDTDVPRLNSNDLYANSTSTRWLTSSNYLSLNNITLGYTVPKAKTKELHIDKVRVYVAADNIGLISARKGLDPRQSYTTSTTAVYTQMRTISGGINITF